MFDLNVVTDSGGIGMGTAFVGVIVILMVAAAIRSMIKDKKNGKSLQCGGDCSKCKGCH